VAGASLWIGVVGAADVVSPAGSCVAGASLWIGVVGAADVVSPGGVVAFTGV
jgi:hypothetical protein